jgi:hypothetical protein
MFKPIFLAILFVNITIVSAAQADTLMIISSSSGMYGDAKANLAMETFGLDLVASSLKKNYRKVYQWSKYSTKSLKDFAIEVVREQAAGEALDVFSMQHGDLSFLPEMSSAEVESIIPFKMIRRVYTTGCSEWGRFSADPDGQKLQISQAKFSDHMKRLGVEEYIVHANDNYTGPVSLPILLSDLKNSSSWIVDGKKSFLKMDDLSAKFGEGILSLQKTMSELLGTSAGSMGHVFFSGLLSYFGSRPVFGGNSFPQYAAQFSGVNMLDSLKLNNDEAMLSPSANLVTFFEKNMPNVFSSSYGNYNSTQASDKKTPLSESISAAAQLISKLFSSYGDKNGCVDTRPFQGLIDSYLVNQYKMKIILSKFCMKPHDENNDHFDITWKLAYPVTNILLPEKVNNLVTEVKINSLSLNDFGSIKIDTRNDTVRVDISGISILAEGPRITDELKIPNGMLRFSPRSLGIDGDGKFWADSWTSIPGLSVGVRGIILGGQVSSFSLHTLGKDFLLQ